MNSEKVFQNLNCIIYIQVEKINFEWKEVKTSSETEGDENKLKAEFNAMMIPLPEVTVNYHMKNYL